MFVLPISNPTWHEQTTWKVVPFHLVNYFPVPLLPFHDLVSVIKRVVYLLDIASSIIKWKVLVRFWSNFWISLLQRCYKKLKLLWRISWTITLIYNMLIHVISRFSPFWTKCKQLDHESRIITSWCWNVSKNRNFRISKLADWNLSNEANIHVSRMGSFDFK